MSAHAASTEPASTEPAVSMLTGSEQRSAARQLTLAMLALGLLGLGLVWRFVAPEQTGVSQVLLGVKLQHLQIARGHMPCQTVPYRVRRIGGNQQPRTARGERGQS